MGFTIADLIIVLVVIGVLAVYRRLDSNNRSLDKVKRFIDRVQAEMDEIVAEKVTMLKDIGIEVDVHQKAATEVIKRVQSIENDLSSRADTLDEIGNRLSSYENALNELVGMTRRAEENIARVRDESEYVDKVGKRIKATQAKMEELETSLPGIVSGFEAQNLTRIAEVEEKMFKDSEDRVTTLTTRVETAAMRVQDFSEEVAGRQTSLDDQFQAARQELEERYEQLATNFRNELTTLAQNGRREIEIVRDEIHSSVAEAAEKFERFRGDSIEQLESIGTSLETVVADASDRMNDLGEKGRALETEVFRSLTEHIEQQGTTVREEIDSRFAKLRTTLESEVTRFNQLGQNLDEQAGGIVQRIDALVDDLTARINGSSQTTEQRVLATVESRLEDYEKEIGYRYTRIEAVNNDIDELEKNMRLSMEHIGERVRNDFLAFGEELHGLRQRDRNEVEDQFAGLRTNMEELETGLNELKQRAYDNVSEKLKVFEDEFFTDLRERSAAMEARITEWRGEVDSRLGAYATQSETERSELETQYNQELRSKLHHIQEWLSAQLTKLEGQFDSFRQGLEGRVETGEQEIAEFEKAMQEELLALKERAFQEFRREFTLADEQTRTQVREFQEETGGRIESIRAEISDGKAELEQMLVASRSDISLWRTELVNQLKSNSADVTNELADAKVQLSANLEQLKQEYVSERQELVEKSQEQRRRIWSDVETLSRQVADLQEQLQSKTRQVLDDFGERFQRLKNDVDTHEREIGDDLSAQSQSFRTLIADSREQFQAMRDKLFARLEEDTSTLTVTVSEIDKRQKAFLEQTALFERADSLKNKLTEDIDGLKAELARVETVRGEVREIETQFGRIRKTASDATEKMSRFSADKRRIELLENDYRRLITLAQTVEGKIEQVGDTDSQLEEIVARFRSLDDLQSEVDARFDRLEKRRALIDKTSDDIEVNNRALADVERRIGEIGTRIQSMPDTIGDLMKKLQQLASAREETNQAVQHLSTLESTMDEIENRMKNLNTAREWLARTETRLEQIRKDAGEQVKLLGSILREESKKEPGQRGAPSLSARETVTKLAGQGWKVEEIARATKVSRGEVELILELSGIKS